MATTKMPTCFLCIVKPPTLSDNDTPPPKKSSQIEDGDVSPKFLINSDDCCTAVLLQNVLFEEQHNIVPAHIQAQTQQLNQYMQYCKRCKKRLNSIRTQDEQLRELREALDKQKRKVRRRFLKAISQTSAADEQYDATDLDNNGEFEKLQKLRELVVTAVTGTELGGHQASTSTVPLLGGIQVRIKTELADPEQAAAAAADVQVESHADSSEYAGAATKSTEEIGESERRTEFRWKRRRHSQRPQGGEADDATEIAGSTDPDTDTDLQQRKKRRKKSKTNNGSASAGVGAKAVTEELGGQQATTSTLPLLDGVRIKTEFAGSDKEADAGAGIRPLLYDKVNVKTEPHSEAEDDKADDDSCEFAGTAGKSFEEIGKSERTKLRHRWGQSLRPLDDERDGDAEISSSTKAGADLEPRKKLLKKSKTNSGSGCDKDIETETRTGSDDTAAAKFDAEEELSGRRKLMKPFSCLICSKRFLQADSMQRHISGAHADTDLPPIGCVFCPQRFAERKTYNLHRLTHKGDKPSFECDICGQWFATRQRRFDHIQAKWDHQRTFRFGCSTCSKRVQTMRDLKYHEKRFRHGNCLPPGRTQFQFQSKSQP